MHRNLESLDSTLKLVTGLIGDTVKVVVTATNVAGSSSETSAATSVIEGLLPSNGKAPEVLGSLVEGQTLSATSGSWSGTEPITYAYQWLQCNAAGEKCTEISKATGDDLETHLGSDRGHGEGRGDGDERGRGRVRKRAPPPASSKACCLPTAKRPKSSGAWSKARR